VIDVKHLSYSFAHQWALKNVSLHVNPGEFTFVTGPSGAGKTTLLRILHGALDVHRGEVTVAGFDLRRLSKRKLPLLRRKVSVVFQDFKVLLDRTVAENVACPLEVVGMERSKIRKRVNAVVRGLGLEKKSALKCAALSGGEQQRVAIARAIVVNPQILLADEPTGNLDESLSMRLMEVFKQFNIHGSTVVIATHNKQILQTKPEARFIHLLDGQLVNESGVNDLEDLC
jgi:cell division transport system ATP-binding protein